MRGPVVTKRLREWLLAVNLQFEWSYVGTVE